MDGYFALDFNGDTIGLHFGLPANRMYLAELRDNPYLVDANGSVAEVGIAYLIYFAYVNECVLSRQKEKYTFRDFLLWTEKVILDPARQGVLTEIAQAYKASREIQEESTKEDEATDAKKKKKPSTGTTLKVSATES